MTNSRASRKSTLLDNHLATGTEATYTFTKSLDMKNTYREIEIIISGSATAALSLDFKLSAHTNYDVHQFSMDVGTGTPVQAVDLTAGILLGAGILDGAVPFFGKLSIFLNDANDKMCIISTFAAPHEGGDMFWTSDETAATVITSIEILTSTSTWIAGTEISIYGTLR